MAHPRTATMSTQEVVAETIAREARSQGQAGMRAVAWVIRNRAMNPRWWGKDWREVCLKRYQFSCWLESDPQYARFIMDKSPTTPDGMAYSHAYEIAQEVMEGKGADPTGGADHYYDTSISPPKWAVSSPEVFSLGRLRFHRVEL